MHGSEQHQTRLHRSALLAHLEQLLDHTEALQSLELQRLRLEIGRRQPNRPAESSRTFDAAMIPVRVADFTVRRQRAA